LRGEMTGAALFDRIRRAFDASGRTDRQ
jgi:hypothetical protein